MQTTPFVTIGRIIKTHGTHGEVSFAPTDGLPVSLLEGLEVWVVPPTTEFSATRIESVRPGPKGPLLRLADVASIERAATLRGRQLTARASDLPAALAEPAFDPVGWRVVDESGTDLGHVVETIVTGANDVWVVEEGPFGQFCLPVIDDVILELDSERETATVHLLPGLVEKADEPT